MQGMLNTIPRYCFLFIFLRCEVNFHQRFSGVVHLEKFSPTISLGFVRYVIVISFVQDPAVTLRVPLL